VLGRLRSDTGPLAGAISRKARRSSVKHFTPKNYPWLSSTHIHGAHVPVEEPSTASIADTSELLAVSLRTLGVAAPCTLLGCAMSDPKDQEESGRDPAASECVVLWPSLHSVPINSRPS